MQQKLCLWLAAVVLLGALLAGNPFLGDRALRSAGKAPLASPVAAPIQQQHQQPAQQQREPALALRADGAAHSRATPALAVASTTALPADASAELCPDLALRPRVASVERDGHGELVWVLRDGTRWVRNKDRAAGQPQMIAVDADVTR